MLRYVRCKTCVVQVSDVNGLVERLLMFLESGYDHIVAETLIQLRDLLRRYPDLGEVSGALDYLRPAAHQRLEWHSTRIGGLVGTVSASIANHGGLISQGAPA
jgi:hypothetical protein